MSGFKYLMKVFGGPMGGASYVPVRSAGTVGTLIIDYNNQILTVAIDDLEKAIAAVRRHNKEKLAIAIDDLEKDIATVRRHNKEKLTIEDMNKSYEIVNTTDTDSNDTCDKHYYVKIVNKKITKVGATVKESNHSYWFFSLEDPETFNTKKRIQEIMKLIEKLYPKFYKIVQRKVNSLA